MAGTDTSEAAVEQLGTFFPQLRRTQPPWRTMSTTVEQSGYLPLTDPQFVADPYPWYERLQRERPVYRLDEHTFVVSRYADIMANIRLPVMQTANPPWITGDPWEAWQHTSLLSEPPDHTRLRSHTNKWFTQKRVQDWATTTRQLAEAALDNIGADGVIDAHHELGVLPTHKTMCRVLQLPADNLEPIAEAMTAAMIAIGFVHTDEQLRTAERGFGYINGRIAQMLTDKRNNPGDGLADALLAAQDRGELTASEVVETVSIFYAQASPNPTYLIDSGLQLFAEHPDLLKLYRQEPDIRTAFINELVRLHPVELSVTRFNTEEVEIGGVTIPAESKIQFMLAAANRDPEIFHRPHEFDHTRSGEASRNLSFGTGIHSCAGQLIARAETETVLAAVAERFSRIELVGEPEVGHTERFRTFKQLTLRLT